MDSWEKILVSDEANHSFEIHTSNMPPHVELCDLQLEKHPYH